MATFIIRITLDIVEAHYYDLLEMAKEEYNFILTDGAAAKGKEFGYHGNSSLATGSDAVKRAAASTGTQFAFAVDKR